MNIFCEYLRRVILALLMREYDPMIQISKQSLRLGILFFSIILSCKPQQETSSKTKVPQFLSQEKPDLLIEEVAYEVLPLTGETVQTGRALNFKLKIKNVGNGDFQERFYVSNTRSSKDLEMEHYSHSQRVNESRKKIPVGASIEVQVQDEVHADTIRFLINTKGKKTKNIVFPRIQELSYGNNTYLLTIIN